MDKLNPTNSTAMPIMHYTPVTKSSPISMLKHTYSISDPKLASTGPLRHPCAVLTHASDSQIACTDVPPHLIQLPAVTNNFKAIKWNFWCESVIVSG